MADPRLARAHRVLDVEMVGLRALRDRLGEEFARAIDVLLGCRGKVIVTGVGKSGIVCRKMAATFSSTGTPALFLHAGEGTHGDLGTLGRGDVLIAVSNSGETEEVLRVLPLARRFGVPLVAMTGRPDSTLARAADVALDVSVPEEACPHGLAPTASTTVTMALGDALAVALLDARGFSADDFARSHPGGSLGRKLLTHVSDVMRTGDAIPAVALGATLAEAVIEISRKGMGMTAVIDGGQRLIGIFTDGDLRRSLERDVNLRGTRVDDVMTRNPRCVRPDALAAEAVEMMERTKSTQIPVVDAEGRLVGALNIHDLFRSKVV